MSSHRVGGWEGLTAKFVVGNTAQRCDCHKLAGFWWVGGVRSCVQISCSWPFWSSMSLRATLKDLPLTQRCVGSVYFDVSVVGSASVQQLYTNVISSCGRVGGSHCKVCDLKNAELEPKRQKYTGRLMFRGDMVKDDSAAHMVFTEQRSSASQTTAAKEMLLRDYQGALDEPPTQYQLTPR